MEMSRFISRLRLRPQVVLAALAAASAVYPARGADVTWDNGSANFLWDTTSLNWTGAAWNNANGDGAIFGATGVGAINVTTPVNVNSMNFNVDGYSLSGSDITFVNGVSTQTTGVVNVATSCNATINNKIISNVGFQKIGSGTLNLNGSNGPIVGNVGLDGRSTLQADVLVGGSAGPLDGGFLRLGNANAMPSNARVSIGTGYLDIGNNNVTLGELTYINQNPPGPWNTTLNANNGVIGSGTLRVLGDINVIGVAGGNSTNAIAANVDLGGGTQVVRIAQQGSSGVNGALIFAGSLSNGSLLKSYGTSFNGVMAQADGMSLFGNNTYTGSTVLNAGNNVIAGTNATTSIKIVGSSTGGSLINFIGANGSAQGATLLQAFSGGGIVLDNNHNPAFLAGPPTPAAQNNDRIRDDAVVELREGTFIYRGLAATNASETLGSMSVLGGHNIVQIVPNNVGTATVTGAGNLAMAPRSTLVVQTLTTGTGNGGNLLGGNAQLKFNGTVPAGDATGILPRVASNLDFLTYNGATGMTPYTGYATDFSTPGTNVSIGAATTVNSSVNINALKRTAGFTLTIDPGQTLGIDSGMILSASGTATTIGGTLAFGPKPGVLFGTNTISSAITGTDGLIVANSTATLSGDLSGLGGSLDVNGTSGNLNLNTSSFTGPIKVRAGFLNLNVSQTGAGLGAITLGVPENDSNLIPTNPTLALSGAGANATFARDLIVDNGATNAAGREIRYGFNPGMTVLSNTTGSQTWSGNITLNTGLRIQGGGASAASTGATNFTGNISGPGRFFIANGRVNFSGNYSNTGGFLIGDGGFTAKVSFLGTGSGNGSMLISSNFGGAANQTTMSYVNGGLQSGPIMVWNSAAGQEPHIIPLNNSTINNEVRLGIGPKPGEEGNAVVNVGSGITAEWAGPLTGFSPLTKIGTGALVLSSNSSTHTGPVTVSAGTLRVNGSLPSSSVTVASGATLGGTGALSGDVNVSSGGILSPGASIGTLETGDLSLAGSLDQEIDLNNGGPQDADLLDVTGSVLLNNPTLTLFLQNLPASGGAGNVYLLAFNDGTDAVTGTFGAIAGLPVDYTATVDYAFSGVDSLGRVGDGNDIAVTIVPEPSSMLLALAGGMLAVRRRSRKS
jgi:autotransporter-associated beta strand protein